MRSRLPIHPERVLLALLVFLLAGAAPGAVAQPRATLVIVGGWDDGAADAGPSPVTLRYWVVLGEAGTRGSVSAPSARDCAATTVEFSTGPSPTLEEKFVAGRTVTVTAQQLDRWGASRDQLRAFRSVAMDGADRRFCVATTGPRFASATAGQTVTARVKSDSTRATPATLGVSTPGDRSAGGVYESALVQPTARLVIVDRSAGRPYAYSGTQIPGTYAVALGAWDPSTEQVRPPTPAECGAGEVRFSLLAPEKAGTAPVFGEVKAAWVDSDEATRLFPVTFQTDRCATGQARRGDDCPPRRPDRPAAMLAALAGDHGAQQPGFDPARAPYLCVAEAPVLVADRIGTQRLVADVVSTGTRSDLSLVERLRQPSPLEPGGQAAFDPIYVHAPPRPVFGLIASTGDITADSAGTGVKTATLAGLDFALEPALRPILDRIGVPLRRTHARLVLGTNITGDLGDVVYAGLSLPSVFGRATATASPIDLSVGLAYQRRDETLIPSGSVTVDIGGAFKALATALGIE